MIAYVFEKYPKIFTFELFIILQQFTREICYFFKAFLEAIIYLLLHYFHDCTFKQLDLLTVNIPT